MRRRIFASVKAQHQNLGDVAIRSQMVEWIARAGEPHLLTQSSPEYYLDALAIPPSIARYDNPTNWLSELIRASRTGRSALVYSPGPQTLDNSFRCAAPEAARTALSALLRAGGNPVVKLGRSYENPSRIGVGLARTHDSALSGVFVRDAQSAAISGNAIIVPDLALGIQVCESSVPSELAVSLRGDRTSRMSTTVDRIRQVAGRFNLTPVVVCQVETDLATSRHLAELLGAELRVLVPARPEWRSDMSSAYRGASLVVSDRLHASLFGVLHGALPVLPPTSGRKQHAALMALNMPTATLSSIGVELDPSGLSLARAQITLAVQDARTQLNKAETRFRQLILEGPLR